MSGTEIIVPATFKIFYLDTGGDTGLKPIDIELLFVVCPVPPNGASLVLRSSKSYGLARKLVDASIVLD